MAEANKIVGSKEKRLVTDGAVDSNAARWDFRLGLTQKLIVSSLVRLCLDFPIRDVPIASGTAENPPWHETPGWP